ncbi:MAG: carbohydrate-binding domain-containing protein, partial [Candidatus Niameybacter stercoravium]|nr:carbohydrate-binding domain-containing protein [Candidatus Niameybacter stercoravium]
GTYRISGELSYGQIFVNVGKEEKDKVTLILDNVDINCTVAPAIFFYKVYECNADATTETATNQVDTSQAGARVILADDSVNAIKGSHVARIYKDNDEQKKLHKYDGAFYSRMSMEIDGESKGNGILNITADNEGLDTEMHLTLNGGVIHIQSADDGINVNEDGISVLTINGGYLSIFAGNGKEGDGIDSNGWIVINDGTVISLANPNSMDGGIDSDMGTSINGGTVVGAGSMYDPLENNSEQLFMFLQFAEDTDDLIVVTDEKDVPIFAYDFPYDYTYISFSTPTLTEGTYHVYKGGNISGTQQDGLYSTITSYSSGMQLHHGGTSLNGGKGDRPDMNDRGERPAFPNNGEIPTIPEKGELPAMPEDMKFPMMPENGERPAPPEGMENPGRPGGFGGNMQSSSDTESYDFVLTSSSRSFTNISSNPLSTSTPNNGTGFTDVASNSWYAEAIKFCQEKGLMSGTSSTTFSPLDSVTREMFATILHRLAGLPKVSATSIFSDANPKAYYYDAVLWANQEGITKGIGNNTFGVGQSITLKDAITMFNRYEQNTDFTSLIENATSSEPATRAQIAFLLMQYYNR